MVGFASGRIASLPTNLPLIKGFSVIGVRAGEYARRDPVRGAENRLAVDALAAAPAFGGGGAGSADTAIFWRGLIRPPPGGAPQGPPPWKPRLISRPSASTWVSRKNTSTG